MKGHASSDAHRDGAYAEEVRTIAVATTSRSDYSTCRSLLRALAGHDRLAPRVLAAGTHLADAWGGTIAEIEADALAPIERLEGFSGATAEDSAASIAVAARAFAASFARRRPDLVVVVGDRIELLGVAGAALPFLIPIAHVSGGDTTGGAIDDLVRHAVSKLAHLHFVAMPQHAELLESMGEPSWRITVTGDPALDDIRGPWPPLDELELGVEPARPLGVVGFHPATLSDASPAAEAQELLAAVERFPGALVFTSPSADPGAREISELLEAFVAAHPRSVYWPSLGQDRYYALLAHADVLIGNSSSGVWEAPSFELPAVNIGERQRGRIRAANVIDAPADRAEIEAAIARALDPSFRDGLRGIVNPYGDGRASERIATVLDEVELDRRLIAKWTVSDGQESGTR